MSQLLARQQSGEQIRVEVTLVLLHGLHDGRRPIECDDHVFFVLLVVFLLSFLLLLLKGLFLLGSLLFFLVLAF